MLLAACSYTPDAEGWWADPSANSIFINGERVEFSGGWYLHTEGTEVCGLRYGVISGHITHLRLYKGKVRKERLTLALQDTVQGSTSDGFGPTAPLELRLVDDNLELKWTSPIGTEPETQRFARSASVGGIAEVVAQTCRDGGAGPSASVFPPTAVVEGEALPIWTQRYWRWLRSFPRGNRPSDDATGILCNARQDQSVFFLAGSSQTAPIARKCTVPSGVPVLVPILNVIASAADPIGDVGCEELGQTLAKVSASATDLSLIVNGKSVSSEIAEIHTGCFQLETSPGHSQASAASGHWAMLGPLSSGTYHIRLFGRYEYDGFWQDVSYDLTVE